jgi:hypothetical protein
MNKVGEALLIIGKENKIMNNTDRETLYQSSYFQENLD